MIKAACIALLTFVSTTCFAAQLVLPSVFTDHMVLQREQAVPVWGTSDPGDTVTVEFAGQKQTTTADKEGKWSLKLAPLSASAEPQVLTVSSRLAPSVTRTNVLIGEVWLCSGQSNMQWSMDRTENGAAAIAAATHPHIRLYNTPRVPSASPRETIDAKWTPCNPETAKGFSAVAYYFGRKLNQDLGVPVGLLLSAWGGTRIEPWTPPCGFEGIESLASIHQQVQSTLPSSPLYKKTLSSYVAGINEWTDKAEQALQSESYLDAPPAFPSGLILGGNQQTPTKLYNGMLHAHIPYAIRGAIWYQGESNHTEGMLYRDKTEALLKGWRKLWGHDLPYYFVQIAPFQYGNEDPTIMARFWEAQAEIVKTIPNTGMAVVSDYTTLNDIHPPNKLVPGTRLALLAEAHTYGMDVVSTGPTFESLEVTDGALKVVFDSAEGLTTRDGKAPDWFEVAGEDRAFKKAAAEISGNAVILTSAEVAKPLAVRFAWHKLATPNLMNAASLPAATFRAGKLPEPPNPATKLVPEAAGFRMVYQLDIPVGADYSRKAPKYAVDNTKTETAPFSQIAYFLELHKADGSKQHAFASMDSFTDDISNIGVPIAANKARFTQKVSNLTVRSNVKGVTPCTDSDGGNVEFWPGNYGGGNEKGIPGASEDYDFGDAMASNVPGYGCMQVHNWKAKQTVFAINKWGSGGTVDVGTGNAPTGKKDWTFLSNGNEYTLRRLTVMVK